MEETRHEIDPIDQTFYDTLPDIGHVDITPENEPITGKVDSIDNTKDSDMAPGKNTVKKLIPRNKI